MKSRRLVPIAAVFVLGILVGGVSASSARAEVVFGNLGNAGTAALAPSTNAAISDITWVMHGFTVGGTNTVLQSVTLGLYDNDSTTARVQIFADSGGAPSGSALGTQTATVSTTIPTLTSFNFGNLSLTSGNSYWAVVSAPNASSLFNWAFNGEGNFPAALNASGWTAMDPVTKLSGNGGATWDSSGVNRPASISIQAVPEPSTVALGVAGVTGLVAFRLRRRMTRVG